MRTVTFKSVLDGVATRLGLSPVALLADQAAALGKYLEDRVRDKWELYDWPFSRMTEARVYRPRWSDNPTVVTGDVIYHAGAYWAALQDAPTDAPEESSAQWEAAGDFERYVLLEQPGKTEISEVVAVWDRNPKLHRNAAAVPFAVGNDRVDFAVDAPVEVWVEFSTLAPRFSTVAWSGSTAYVTGDVVYVAPDCWMALQGSTNQAPAEGDYWRKQNFPHQLSRFAELGAVADCLNESNQHDKAKRMEDLADEKLLDELEKLFSKQGQAGLLTVRNR